jgi:hypothetical protein
MGVYKKLIFMGNFSFLDEPIVLSNVTVGKIYDVEVIEYRNGEGILSLNFTGDDGMRFSISSHFITEGYFVELDVYREKKLEEILN